MVGIYQKKKKMFANKITNKDVWNPQVEWRSLGVEWSFQMYIKHRTNKIGLWQNPQIGIIIIGLYTIIL